MNESQIAGIFRATKPKDKRLRDGWTYSVLSFARSLKMDNSCFDPRQFLWLCELDANEERKFRDRYEDSRSH